MNHRDPLISAAALAQCLDDPAIRVVDCRFDLFDAEKGRRDYSEGHLPGAVYADMDRDLAAAITSSTGRHPLPEPAKFVDTLSAWGINNDSHVVAYDYGNGSLAVRLWWMLYSWLGHTNVSVLDGGIAAWTEVGGKLVADEPDPLRAEFSADPDDSVIASTAEIAAALESGKPLTVIDARDAARFRGEVEPIDTRAGHIPGARNLPFAENLDEHGRWHAVDVLDGLWDGVADPEGPEPPVVMCGSGVTACHLVLSAVRAGRPVPRLYVGSWSEWIRDENRPIAGGDGGSKPAAGAADPG